MRSISCSLIISTYNNPKALLKILSSIEEGSQLPKEILIADDGSRKETKELIATHPIHSKCQLIHCWQEDQGFRKSRILNQAIVTSSGDYIIFLDGDCIPEKQFIADHMALAERKHFVQGRRAFIDETEVQSFIENKTSLIQLALKGKLGGGLKAIRWPFPKIKKDQGQRGLIGCNLAIWKNDLLLVNGFDEEYEGWGGEDSDLCTRLYHNNISRKLVYGRCRVYHLNHREEDKADAYKRFERLEETILKKKTVCKVGIKYLN
jgi:glycosyltransferase involved in cell wall biosynthesis